MRGRELEKSDVTFCEWLIHRTVEWVHVRACTCHGKCLDYHKVMTCNDWDIGAKNGAQVSNNSQVPSTILF